ncbi:MAG: 5-carboxymethyl-2-hydroxymuconate Delta-isomerase [Alphaproteobacteria bacterium]|nr:5-carboxymethyl-2-hydroxymuconate Delta-isomerase [Alphaproteobacteria bacterium]
MPHLVIEASNGLISQTGPKDMMKAAHDVAAASGQFGEGDIKVRLFSVDHALVGGKAASTLHITLYLLSGRDRQTKKALTEALVERFSTLVPKAASVSANAIDMDRETYSKISR